LFFVKINDVYEFLYLTKENITDIITPVKMNYTNTNITKQNKAFALEVNTFNILFNLPISVIILLGINLILSLIIIKG